MTINSKYYGNVAPTIRKQILGSSYAFKLVKKIFTNILYAFLQQFMKSSMSWDMFGKIWGSLKVCQLVRCVLLL